MITKIWVVSIVLEPLLLFVIADRHEVGIGLNISRILQFVVVSYLFFKLLFRQSFWISERGLFLFKPYSTFILYTYTATLCSLIFGLYPVSSLLSESRDFIEYLNSSEFRPIIEAIIIFYQFIYFFILPLLFLKEKADFDFFFKVLFFFLALHFGLGYIDFILNLGGFQLIPRHLGDGVQVGLRWHGIAGEPRDAAIYNMSLFFIIAVYSIYKHGQITKINPVFLFFLVISMLLTFSASFVVGVVIAAGFIILIYLPGRSLTTIVNYGAVGVVFSTAMFFTIQNSPRLVDYYESYRDFLFYFYQNPHIELPYLIKISFNNVYPMIFLLKDFFQNLNFYSLLFGYGIGSSGVVNQDIYGEFYNPNNQFVRIIFEYGIFGSALLIFGIKLFLKRTCKLLDRKDRNLMLMLTFIMIGGILAHRSNVWMIWLGIFGAVSVFRHRLNCTRAL